ncbi:MAG: long-chain fatty acid transporter [Nitrospirae bacterium]|nr:MAG: long-chain fatty acid transporter [Nitrospirota bacterium]
MRISLFVIATLLVWTTTGFAEAFRILDQSAAATGQAAAFAAQADDPSAIHYNPAAMPQLRGIQFSIGTNVIGGQVDFTSSSGTSVEGDFGGSILNPPPSQVYLTMNLGDLGIASLENWVIGLGVTSPYGINVEYPDSSPFADTITGATLPLIDIKPTVAARINPYLSVGAGLDLYTFASFLGDGQAEIRCTGCFGFPAGAKVEANGTDTALGFNVSLLLTPFRTAEGKPLMNLAFVYRSRADLDFHGDILVNGSLFSTATSTLELPQVFTGGLAIWPIRTAIHEWKIEVDLDYADWNEFQNLNLTLPSGSVVPVPRNYGDSFVVMVGTEHRWLALASLPHWELAVRGGYLRSETPIPSRFFEPGVPDADYHALSLGFGALCKDHGRFLGLIPCHGVGSTALGLDLAYQVLLYQTRGITNNVNTGVNGEWDTTIHVGAITLRVNF